MNTAEKTETKTIKKTSLKEQENMPQKARKHSKFLPSLKFNKINNEISLFH